jgi:hypothetical protein
MYVSTPRKVISVISHKTYDHDMFPGPLSLCGVRPLPFHSILNRTGGLFRSSGFGAGAVDKRCAKSPTASETGTFHKAHFFNLNEGCRRIIPVTRFFTVATELSLPKPNCSKRNADISSASSVALPPQFFESACVPTCTGYDFAERGRCNSQSRE